MRAVAILETMWDWNQQTSSAGYSEAPRFFKINPSNHSGRMLYKLVGKDSKLLVTNACRELVTRADQHGKPDPAWLRENLEQIESTLGDRSATIQVLLVCGRVAQTTFKACGYKPLKATPIEIPHPAARGVWSTAYIEQVQRQIQEAYGKSLE